MAMPTKNKKITVYAVRTKGGGVDGMDFKDKPKDKDLYPTCELAEAKITAWDEEDPVPRLLDIKKVRRQALAKLNAAERFAVLNPDIK